MPGRFGSGALPHQRVLEGRKQPTTAVLGDDRGQGGAAGSLHRAARHVQGRSSDGDDAARRDDPRHFRFALLLRDSYGWSLDRVESWMTAASQALLLGPRKSRR